MLLKYFYDFAHSRKLLKDTAFVDKPIRWIIPVSRQGHLIADGLIETEGQDKKAKVYEAPKTFVDKGTGGIAEFLADSVTALFGLDPDPYADLSEKQRTRRDENNTKKYNHFWSQIQDAFDHTGSHLLAPILAFHQNFASSPPFLRYGKSLDPKREKQKERWWIKRVDGTEIALGADQFTFQVAGVLVIGDDSVIRPYWCSLFQNQVTRKESDSELGICIVTSQENVPIAKTHLPLIKGVPGAKRQDRKIVSFDKDAFVSYGFRQSTNAPVSVEAVIAYVSAMNWMIARDDHSLVTENGMILFWARKSPQFSGIFSSLLKSADPSAVAQFLKSPWAGMDRNLIRQDDFLSVALSG
jgi:CRISPR-associated protein Csd1